MQWFALTDGAYKPVRQSTVVELGATALAEQLGWATEPD